MFRLEMFFVGKNGKIGNMYFFVLNAIYVCLDISAITYKQMID